MSKQSRTEPPVKWWQNSVVYQIYPRSFMDSNGDGIGDLPGILSKLDYLRELGVDVLWISPIYMSPKADNGYDISDYVRIMPEFGTVEDFDRLVNTAHQKGLKIVMDLVVNHTSDEHSWFEKSRASKDSPYREYYIWQEGKDEGPPNNWRSNFSGSAWKYDETAGLYYLHLFHQKQPELNWECAALRQEVYDIMEWWLQRGIDGFRMDVINYIGKDPGYPDGPMGPDGLGDFSAFAVNQPQSHRYLQEMREQVLAKYDILTVGETPFATVADAIQYASKDEKELNMVFQFEHVELDYAQDKSKWSDSSVPLDALKHTMNKWQTGLHEKAWNSLYWGNHDQPRPVSRMGNDSDPFFWEKSAKMLATCLYMMQGTPYVYQGEEIGMTNFPFKSIDQFHDVESINAYYDYTKNRGITPETMLIWMRSKSRDNARSPMQWTSGKNAGFTIGEPWFAINPNYNRINTEAQSKDENSIYHFYRRLFRLRKQVGIITHGDFALHQPEHPQVFSYLRQHAGQTLWVACNFSQHQQSIQPPHLPKGAWNFLLGNYLSKEENQTVLPLELKSYEAVVFLHNALGEP